MKLLIGITSCWRAAYPPSLEREEPKNNTLCHQSARDTWTKDAVEAGIDYKFFFGRPPVADAGVLLQDMDEVRLDADDSYDGLIDKVSKMCQWAYDHGYDYLMKVDIDSYIHVKNLLASEFRNWDYTGRGWGLGYVLSRRAMKIIAEATQKRSWAEDAHALRTLLAWGDKHPEAKLSLYGDGRYTFLPNLTYEEGKLLDKEFIVANPATPSTMYKLHDNPSLLGLLPLTFQKEDMWTAGENRIQHSNIYAAFVIKGEPMPITYTEWCKLSAYEKQPFRDWKEIVLACMETEQMEACPTFKEWMGPIEGRNVLLNWARKTNKAVMDNFTKRSLAVKAEMEGK